MDWPLLADLPAEDVRQLLSIARRRTFAHGEVVFHRDDPADSLHLILRGRFGVRVATPLGDSVLLDVLGPGQSFGELALLAPGSARSATVSAEMAGTSRATAGRGASESGRARAWARDRPRPGRAPSALSPRPRLTSRSRLHGADYFCKPHGLSRHLLGE